MASNTINLVIGNSAKYRIGLVDQDGQPFPLDQLTGALASFVLKNTAADVGNILAFDTTDATHMAFVQGQSAIDLAFIPNDTVALSAGQYVYQVQLTLADGSVYTIIAFTPANLTVGGTGTTPPAPFTNTVQVDHNYPTTDNLRYMAPDGTPIQGAQIRVYLKSDYDAGRLSSPVGVSLTDAFGRWTNPVLVNPGFSYTVQFFLPNQFGPDVITVTA